MSTIGLHCFSKSNHKNYTIQSLDHVGAQATASVEVRTAVGQLQSGPPGCSDTLQKILLNIVRNPTDPKYKKIRLGNPKIQAAVVDVDGGLELLQVNIILAQVFLGAESA